MDNIYGNYDNNGNLVGVFRNPGDVAPFTATDAELENCCCGCGQDVKEAVAERQKAAGVTPIDTSQVWDLSELKTKVNNIAPNYVDGTYTGGTSKPTMLSDSYADSAATCDELLTLVKDMLQTKPSASQTADVLVRGYGYDTSEPYDSWGTVRTEAENDFGDEESTDWANWFRTAYEYDNSGHQAKIQSILRTVSIAGLSSDVSHTAKLFIYPETYRMDWGLYWSPSYESEEFNKQGSSIPNKQTWGQVTESGYVTTSNIDMQWGDTSTGFIWPLENPPVGSEEAYSHGWEVNSQYDTGWFLVIQWDFTYQ